MKMLPTLLVVPIVAGSLAWGLFMHLDRRSAAPASAQATRTQPDTYTSESAPAHARYPMWMSADARYLAYWIADSRDAERSAYVIVDKKAAAVHVFDAEGQLRGSSPVLLGSAKGDDSVAGIGDRPLHEVMPHERTTPAGRFLARRGKNTLGEDVIWVDYDAAVSMHRLRATNPEEQRLARLESGNIDDNRISYGCINIPADFYEAYIQPAFTKAGALVYVLPEQKSISTVFGAYDAEARGAKPGAPRQPVPRNASFKMAAAANR